jgi:hypothetical protein
MRTVFAAAVPGGRSGPTRRARIVVRTGAVRIEASVAGLVDVAVTAGA